MRIQRLLLVLVLTCVSCYSWGYKADVLEEKGHRTASYKPVAVSKTIVFIHGMYLTPDSWRQWESYFQNLGYETYTPAWPQHELSVIDQNAMHPNPALGALRLSDVVSHYRDFIATLPEPPILIGHSMGGLVVQKLLDEGVAAAGIAIDSAPPFGVLSLEPAFLRANLHVFNPSVGAASPIKLSFKQFQYGFVNGMSLVEQQRIFSQFSVPESRRIGRGTLNKAAKVNTTSAREPLLFIASGNDHTAPPSLNYSNFRLFRNTPAITDYKLFPGRNHWTIGQPGWELVASYVQNWIEKNRVVQPVKQ